MAKKNRKNNGVYQPTYGAGLTGGIGKTVKIIGAILVLIVIIGVAVGVSNSGSDTTEPPTQQIEQTN